MATASAPASSTATVVSATAPVSGAGNEVITREDLVRLEHEEVAGVAIAGDEGVLLRGLNRWQRLGLRFELLQ